MLRLDQLMRFSCFKHLLFDMYLKSSGFYCDGTNMLSQLMCFSEGRRSERRSRAFTPSDLWGQNIWPQRNRLFCMWGQPGANARGVSCRALREPSRIGWQQTGWDTGCAECDPNGKTEIDTAEHPGRERRRGRGGPTDGANHRGCEMDLPTSAAPSLTERLLDELMQQKSSF